MIRPVASSIYWTVERLRSGGSPDLATEASRLLDGGAEKIGSYVESRLEATFGLESPARPWLREQPLTQKADYARESAEAGDRTRRIQLRKTSGSSGRPFAFSREPEQLQWMDAAMWAVYGWHGVQPGMRQARFWGLPVAGLERSKRRIIDRLYNRRRFDAFTITVEKAISFTELLERFRPEFVYGYPTLMREYADLCSSEGISEAPFDARAVICTGEMLTDQVRQQLQAFFRAPILNEYGCTEMGIISFPCEVGTNHEIPIAALPEVFAENRTDQLEEGTGAIALTDLYGSALRFKRYQIGDLVYTRSASCECGRHLRTIVPSAGRIDGIIQTPSGRHVYDAILAYSIPDGVAAFLAQQTAIDELRGKIIVKRGYDSAAMADATATRWREALEGALKVQVEVVSDLPREKSGKLRYFIPLNDHSPGGARKPDTDEMPSRSRQ
jgi:phenylacetate-CoA ligase